MQSLLNICIILMLTILAYSNFFENNFCIDDHLFIVDWPLIQDFGNFSLFWGPHNQPEGEEGVYSPLKTIFHAVNYHWWGWDPLGYHVVALLIHLAGVIFIYKVSLKLTGYQRIAFLTGLFFGLHPVQVEAVSFLTASIDTAGIVFLFAAFYFYVSASEDNGPRGLFYFWSILFSFLAIFTHELAVTLPLLFLWHDLCLGKANQPFLKRALKLSPFAALAGAYVLLKFFITGSINRGGYLMDSPYLTFLLMVKSWAKYVWICLWPLKLSVNHELAPGIFSVDAHNFDLNAVLNQSLFDVSTLLALGITIFLVSAAFFYFYKNKFIAFCLGWFLISLLPVSNIIPSGCYFAERYLYLGSFGFCLLLAYFFTQIYERFENNKIRVLKYFCLSLTMFTLIFYSSITFLRNRDWRGELDLLDAEVRSNPRHPLMRRDLGVNLIRSGQLEQGISHLKEALFLRPLDPDIYFALADGYREIKDYVQMEYFLKEAIKLNPDFAEAYYNLAGLYAHHNRHQEARECLKKALALYESQGMAQEADLAKKLFYDYFKGQDNNEDGPAP